MKTQFLHPSGGSGLDIRNTAVSKSEGGGVHPGGAKEREALGVAIFECRNVGIGKRRAIGISIRKSGDFEVDRVAGVGLAPKNVDIYLDAGRSFEGT